MVTSRGAGPAAYAGAYGEDASDYRYERVCVAYDAYGDCLRTRLVPPFR